MYKEYPVVFEKPEDENAKIWRYADFAKFLDLLDKKMLFFPRADKLGDPFEGSFPRGNVTLRPITYKNIPKDELGLLSEFYRLFVKFTAISCWHLNDFESAAMWKLYLKSDEGIAIQSTFKRLRDSFQDAEPTIYIGRVKYLDYDKELISREGSLSAFVHKRKSFEHEQELRAVIQELPSKGDTLDLSKPLFDDGIYVQVDLSVLIDRIYLAPTSPKWLFELVESVTRKYGLDKKVLQSSLDDVPVY